MSDGREYPSVPRVGVGAVVFDAGRVLLVRRGKPPLAGKWSLPGGLLELGETTAEAAGVLDRVVRDVQGRIRYHWVLVDYVASVESGELCAASDADEAQWVEVDAVAGLDTTDGLMDMIRRAQAVAGRGRA